MNTDQEILETPQALEAERSVLGSILKAGDVMDRVVSVITNSTDFFVPKHKLIYDAMRRLYNKAEPIDITTISSALQGHGELQKVGGRVYLVELVEDVASIANVVHYAEVVADRSRRRQIIASCNEIVSSAYSKELETSDLIEHWQQSAFRMGYSAEKEAIRIQESVPACVDSLLNGGPAIDPSNIIETRIADLNRFLGGGLMKGDTVVVAGPPSMGKTSFSLDICMWQASLGKNSLYFAIDETTRAIEQRVLSGETEFTREQFIKGFTTEEDKKILRQVKDSIGWQPGHVDVEDRSSLTAAEVRSIAKQHHQRHGLDIIVVDYVGRLLPARSSKGRSRYEQVSHNSMMLDALAKDLNVLMIVVSQLNREYTSLPFNPDRGELGIPTQSMLRDSGQLEQDSSQVIFPWRPLEALRKRGYGIGHKYFDIENAKNSAPTENAIIVIAKHKEGPTGRVLCKFNGARMRFYTESSRKEEPF